MHERSLTHIYNLGLMALVFKSSDENVETRRFGDLIGQINELPV